MIYTITLNPALDYVMRVENLRSDDINRSSFENLYYGGKGINVSVVLSRLGIESKALGFVGGFTGEYLKKILCEEGIVCDFTQIHHGSTRINVKIKADVELDINAQGPHIDHDEICALLSKLDDITDGDFLILAGSVPKNLPSDIYERIFQTLEGKNIRFVVDAAGDLLMNVLKYKPFLIKPNHHELGDLFGIKAQSDDDIAHYAAKLQTLGAQNVLVSRANDGALLLDENGHVHKIGTVSGSVVNSVGCGDSMVAGFIAGYRQTKDYGYALTLGSACGNATAFSDGLAVRGEIDDMLNRLMNSQGEQRR